MADYRQVARHFPPVRDYLRHRRWTRRGDVVAYAPGLDAPSFSTDAAGFRHIEVDGRRYSIEDAWTLPAYALVLGSSHVFGFGLASNAQTLGSRLSQRLGHPCLTVCFPEADTRTLAASLTRILATAPRPPSRVFLLNGGDLTRFAYVGRADPVFGCGDFEAADAGPTAAAADAAPLIAFTSLWTVQMAEACARARIPFVLGDEPTFFEKARPNATEIACGLGQEGTGNARRFRLHRRFVWDFHAARAAIRSRMFGQEPWVAHYDAFDFIDEFHYDAATMTRLAALLAP